MKKSQKDKGSVCEIRNKKASHDYFIGETFEAGVALLGPEVKSLRGGNAQMGDAFVRPNRSGELFIYNLSITEYKFHTLSEYNSTRPRKLLLHGAEIRKILVAVEREKMVVIPLKIFFKHGLAKISIAICKGKKLFDKREALKKSEAIREAQKIISNRMRSG
ncbi:MAG: SsrA-binding protein SmpB [Puniceicoccales bacterium]|jgi:SsrA-binding protein|nr:SsrA-binding protein SmpB [Puniceicoccales bacterium]